MTRAAPSQSESARAVLVAVVLPDVSDEQASASLDELARLAKTLGLRTVARVTQRRSNANAASVLGAGKLRELARWTGGSGVVPLGAEKRQKGAQPKAPVEAEAEAEAPSADLGVHVDDPALADPQALDAFVFGDSADGALDELDGEDGDGDGDDDRDDREPDDDDPDEQASVVIFDHDLSPSQLRNVEGATSAEVLDRSSLILRIFQRHARTREARLQVEIAQLKYLAPRLRATGARGDRQRGAAGGIGGKGAGESALELDRRRVRDRIAELEQRLVVVQREASTRRARRTDRVTVALVGYTNAGKSSLMRRLTDSEVLVKNQLFATLDTTVRQLHPPTKPRVLVSDTVGFIKKLPHDLVASFRSTLEEVRDAALLLHVIDASDPEWPAQLEVTRAVIGELYGDAPDQTNEMAETLLVFNKVDKLDAAARADYVARYPDAIVMSALRPADISALHARIVAFFERDMVGGELYVPYVRQRLVHTIHEACRVTAEVHDESGTRLSVRAKPATLEALQQAIARAES